VASVDKSPPKRAILGADVIARTYHERAEALDTEPGRRNSMTSIRILFNGLRILTAAIAPTAQATASLQLILSTC